MKQTLQPAQQPHREAGLTDHREACAAHVAPNHASIMSAHALYGGSQCVCVVISAGGGPPASAPATRCRTRATALRKHKYTVKLHTVHGFTG